MEASHAASMARERADMEERIEEFKLQQERELREFIRVQHADFEKMQTQIQDQMDQAAKGVEDATLPVSIEAQTPNTTLPSTSQIQIAASAPIPSLDRTQNDSGFGQSLPPAGAMFSMDDDMLGDILLEEEDHDEEDDGWVEPQYDEEEDVITPLPAQQVYAGHSVSNETQEEEELGLGRSLPIDIIMPARRGRRHIRSG